jgi:hypothetical protein
MVRGWKLNRGTNNSPWAGSTRPPSGDAGLNARRRAPPAGPGHACAPISRAKTVRVAPVLGRVGDCAAYLAAGDGDADGFAPLRDAEGTRRPPGNADFSAGLERRPGRPVAKCAPGRKPQVQGLATLF